MFVDIYFAILGPCTGGEMESMGQTERARSGICNDAGIRVEAKVIEWQECQD